MDLISDFLFWGVKKMERLEWDLEKQCAKNTLCKELKPLSNITWWVMLDFGKQQISYNSTRQSSALTIIINKFKPSNEAWAVRA